MKNELCKKIYDDDSEKMNLKTDINCPSKIYRDLHRKIMNEISSSYVLCGEQFSPDRPIFLEEKYCEVQYFERCYHTYLPEYNVNVIILRYCAESG